MSQEVLAVVAGEEITQADFDVYLQSVPREQQAYLSNPQFRQQCLEQLISVYLFAKKGEDEKIEEAKKVESKPSISNNIQQVVPEESSDSQKKEIKRDETDQEKMILDLFDGKYIE